MDATATTLLRLDGVTKGFPGVQALKGVSLELRAGEIHALLGENGAGKSTIIKIIGGIQRQDEGEILLDGRAVSFASYRDAIAAGIGIVFQEFSLVPDLDAVDNIFLGREIGGRFGFSRKAAMRARASELMRRLGVRIDLHCPVERLSVADQQFVEIAKALSLDARILILDEPTATLTPSEAAHLFTVMRQLRAQGIGMFFVSHHLDEIFEICDRITVLRDGRNVGLVEVSSTGMDALVEMMVGRRIETSFPPRGALADAATVLEASGLRVRDGGPDSGFSLRRGEILGFAGLVGSGRTETALALIGAIPCRSKSVSIDGRPVALDGPAAALRQGIGLLPENRKTQGLMLGFSIRDNVSINNLAKYTGRAGIIDRALERRTTQALMRQIQIKAPSEETASLTLSGGNQQKVVIARWLNRRSRILIFDEPTRGIDVGAKAEIYRLLLALADGGCSIIMISSELPEIVGMCDRVAVFRRGAIETILSGDDINPEEVMRHATAGANSMSVTTEKAEAPPPRTAWFARLRQSPAFLPAIGLVVVSLCMMALSDRFLSVGNLENIGRQVSINAVISVGMTFAILTGGIDLSVGSVMALAGTVVAGLLAGGVPGVAAIGAGLGVGLLFGAGNGVVIARLGMPPIIVTLASMSIARGLGLIYTNGYPISGLPNWFSVLGRGAVLGIQMPILVMIAVYAVAFVLLQHMPVGRYVYAIGSNEDAVRLSGIDARRYKILVYLISGLTAAIAGIVLSARLMSGQPNAGTGFELDAIAAVVLGGAAISGGRGSIVGTLVGALLLGVLNNGLNLLNVSPYVQNVVKGVIILLAIFISRQRRAAR